MAYAREVPWHGIGTKAEGLMTAAEALKLGGLDWEVIQRPIYAQKSDLGLDMIPIKTHVANVRATDNKVLGVVGRGYRPVQNETALSLMDDIVDSGEAKYETVGALKEGRVVFISMELPKHIRVPGDDSDVKPYILLANGHDGGHALQIIVTPIRVVCNNTLTAALGSRTRERVYLRHTANIESRIGEARRALGITFDYLERFEDLAKELVAKRVTVRAGTKMLETIFPFTEREKENLDLKDRSHFAKALNIWKRGDDLESIRLTGWGLFNAVAEYIDHGIEYRSRTFTPADRKADSILFGGTGAQVKAKTLALLTKS